MSQRGKVLSMYRRAMRISRQWNPASERAYIRDEARRLVRQNKNLSSPHTIAQKVHEFETRIETGLHYKIPYPRPVNVAPGATGKDPETVTPVYLHSYGKSSSPSLSRLRGNRRAFDLALADAPDLTNHGMSFGGARERPDTSSNSVGDTFKLPGAASLYEQLDKLVMVCLRDGRSFFGWLRSFDQYANLILDNTVERLSAEHSYADVPIGIFVIRGENVMLLGEVDEEREQELALSMKQVTESEIRKALAVIKNDRTAMRQSDIVEWPIPEEY